MSDPVTDPGAEFGAQLWESVVEALTASNSLTPSYLAMAAPATPSMLRAHW